MFTIHHQPQLAMWLRERDKPKRLKAIMDKERKSDFLRHAEEKGYLQSPTKNFFLDNGRGKTSEKQVTLLSEIHLLKLGSDHLVNLGQIQLLSRLKICILPGNYISSFATLGSCSELEKLDLHSNQISTLPGPEFWCSLPNLKIVHLHNNSIGKLDCLQHMGEAEGIEVLTLYDTPISLKKTYRHHVVNSIWTLKALDFYVVSDEEIIEDASFSSHFASMNPAFRYNPMPHSKRDSSFEDEMLLVRQVLREVSNIQAHYSPVLILQKVIRGFLVRRQLKLLHETKTWAAVCIQRYWRHFKGLQWEPQTKSITPSKPLLRPEPAPSTAETVSQRLPLTPPATAASIISHIDYDTYLVNRRPGSKTHTMATAERKALETMGYSEQKDTIPSKTTATSIAPGISEPYSSMRKRTNIHIDLTKLQTDSMSQPEEARKAIVFEMSPEESMGSFLGLTKPREQGIKPIKSFRIRKEERPKEKKKKKEFKTVKQMLGPLPRNELERHFEEENDSEEEEFRIKFRLSGLKSVMHGVDFLQELVIARREAGEDIRNTHKDVIDVTMLEMKQKQKPVKSKSVNADQRLFGRVQGTMGMSCLRAVQQAYRDRAQAEKLASTVNKVMTLRENRESSKQRTTKVLEEKRLQALKKKDTDAVEISDSLQRREDFEKVEKARRRAKRSKSLELTRNATKDKSFSAEFTSQNSSISNALQRHDRQAKEEINLQRKRNVIEEEREHTNRQLELVQKYLEHRQMMRQAQVAVERAALDTRMLQEANERLMEARNQIAQQKQKSKTVQAFHSLPKSGTDPVLPPVHQEGKPDRFQTLVAMYEGRVGGHPAVIKT